MLHRLNAYKITWTNKTGDHTFYEFTKKRAENAMERMSFWNPRMEEAITEVYLTPSIKKEFHKIIKEIRGKENEYPRAIMTEAMMERGEATIIFTWQGGDTGDKRREFTKIEAEKMMENKNFTDFINKEEAKAQIELREDTHNYQIRIKF